MFELSVAGVDTLELEAVQTDDDGADGTEPATFVALALGGVALMAALAALIMARSRPPA